MRTTPGALLVALWLLGLTACAAQQAADDAPTASPAPPRALPTQTTASRPGETGSVTATVPASEPGGPGFEGSTETVATPGFPDAQVEGVTYLTAVRAGRHPGFDRVVWTFDGQTPAYRVGYARRPITEDGSGRPIKVDGGAVLQIIFTPASGTDLSSETPRAVYQGDHRLAGSRFGTTVVREVVETGDFEATLSWVVGLDRQAPFTVTELSAPTRVVVDIASG